jgi:2,3-bisphosphoglycerate-dependent phosphoglycerate mutase
MEASLVLVRHGQSVWNAQNRFTGWVDVPLATKGWEEATRAGQHLKTMRFDAAYTSHLQRAICTLQVVLRESESGQTPIFFPAADTLPREQYALKDGEFPVYLHATALAERHDV